ncbi:aldolase/citrate lyase family protein [Undibacterium cyanobacteriorum]|uniref:Aldolase/citrate lyase family protein n=1 Tax=Undibacterium cyanobacteriorum TaxID=3073561 RepID=A0ABY9RFF7_9BURK|nr:aldolase/citrate lyase family protein [Undibacterium sp. 20NA77.5]WMW78957.1 aldolase/citrate lyase family protein [Undibacterium sp. 20NA77.5]
MHPSQALFEDQASPVLLPVCDHYAGSEKLMMKSLALQKELGPVFDITFDCEDGASISDDRAHATLIRDLLLSEHNLYRRIGVRVHDSKHPSFATDLSVIVQSCAEQLAFVMLPKVSGVKEVIDAIEQVNQHAATASQRKIPIHVLIETQSALAEVHEIAAIPQVESLSFGIMDFVSSHWNAIPATAMRSPGQFSHPLVMRAKVEIAAACHLHGKVPSHNVTTEFKDMAIVTSDATRAHLEFGYTRMWSIHPDQIRPIVKAMAPRSSEINEAISILQAAQENSWGPINKDGRLHDRASYRYYWSILKRASMSGMKLPDGAQYLLQ